MKDRIVFVAEYKKKDKHWIEVELDKLKQNYIFIADKNYSANDYTKSYGRLIYWTKYLKLAKKVIKSTEEDDVIVALTFTLGLIISLLCKIYKKKRNILSLNCIAYDNSKFDFIKIPLFRRSFIKNNLISTVNAEEYSQKFNKKFNLDNKKVFYLLNDPYNERFVDKSLTTEGQIRIDYSNSYCFSGGEANRDWETLLNSAGENSKVNFKITARKYLWNNKNCIPKNVEIAFDEDLSAFIKKVKNAEIVIVPLKDDMVAGLTVFIQAIAMKKFVLVSDIPATRKYIPNDCKNVLVKTSDVEDLSNKIKYYYNNEDERNMIADKLYNNLINNFSPECYVKRIVEIVNIAFKKDRRLQS
ncbi:MAG TPA: glycosyltransferase [Clostridium sp.]